ncbi:hypothetical protein J6590_068465 [Homalodisca vitripennis]|nr:hypothetical protein J6590_068465 [Homalodisca vitripennis]
MLGEGVELVIGCNANSHSEVWGSTNTNGRAKAVGAGRVGHATREKEGYSNWRSEAPEQSVPEVTESLEQNHFRSRPPVIICFYFFSSLCSN